MRPHSPRLFALLLVALGVSAVAEATIYTGSPKLHFRVDRPQHDYVDGDVTLDKVVVNHCGGGSTTYDLDESVEPVGGHTVDIDAGDHCTAVFHWSSNLSIDGPSYTVGHNGSTTTIVFDDTIDEVYLSPCSVTSGTMTGGCPRLYAWVN